MLKTNIDNFNDYVYYNAIYTSTSDDDINININEYRSNSILPLDSSNYKLSVERFQIPLATMPILFYPNLNNSGDPSCGVPDNTQWEVAIKIGATTYKKFVIYQPLQNTKECLGTDLRIFHFQHIIDLINKAFHDASVDASQTASPYFVFDNISNMINLYAPSTIYGTSGTGKIYLNRNLWNFFENFHVKFQNIDNSILPFELIIKENGNNFIPASQIRPPQLLDGTFVSSSVDMLVSKAEFISLGYFFSPRSVVFTTSNIPIRSEGIPGSTVNNNSSDSYRNILSDFYLDLEDKNAINSRSIQTFVNNSDDRFISLKSAGKLNNIDIQAYYTDNKNNLIPLKIGKNQTFSIKLKFLKIKK